MNETRVNALFDLDEIPLPKDDIYEEWLEWAAALYESYVADHEAADIAEDYACRYPVTDGRTTWEQAHSASEYANSAHTLAERLEEAIYAADADSYWS